ncbi:MAG: CRISPR-associated ring nuclease [Anaerolineae bacterium]|nr:CRISPR-associated ring nuclease [Anaerolineae bacterium]
MDTTLIATLGSEAQVVTLTIDLLRQQQRHVTQVVVLHTAPSSPPIAEAVQRLADELGKAGALRVAFHELCNENGMPLHDVDSPDAGKAICRAVYSAIREAKLKAAEGVPGGVDLCLAGGRKTMSVYAMIAAQLLFEGDDRVWHLFSAGDLLREKRMHWRPGDEAALVALPLLRYADVAPALFSLMDNADPFAALSQAETHMRATRVAQAREFWRQCLSPAEKSCAALLLCDGLADKQMAERLNKSRKTVETQLKSVYDKAAAFFGLSLVTGRTLASLLAPIVNEDVRDFRLKSVH